jgi:dynein heavy chain
MNDTFLKPIVVEQCLKKGRLEEIKELTDGLEKCQKSLIEYLDSKRNAFPRFFFLSDDELLSILGNTNPEGIQEHIVKVFPNASEVYITYGFIVQALHFRIYIYIKISLKTLYGYS